MRFHDNGETRGFEIGRFGRWFNLHVYYGIPGHSNFRWHVYLSFFYPRWSWCRAFGKRILDISHRQEKP